MEIYEDVYEDVTEELAFLDKAFPNGDPLSPRKVEILLREYVTKNSPTEEEIQQGISILMDYVTMRYNSRILAMIPMLRNCVEIMYAHEKRIFEKKYSDLL